MIKLGEIATYINGRAFKPTEWTDTGLPIVRIENLNDKDAHFNHFDGKLDGRYLVKDGDLLVSWSASLDAYIWDRGDSALNQHIFKVVENEKLIYKNYLYYALREVMSEIREQTHGATMKHITKPEFEAFQIPIPPLPEQKRIAATLTEQLATVEQARKASEARLEAARALPAAYLREVFESEEAKGWPVQKLGNVMQLRRDIVHPKDHPSGKSVFVGLEHIEPGTGKRIGCEQVMKEKLKGRKPQFFNNDIVYGYLRPYLNKVWVAEFDGLCSVDQYVYTINKEIALTEYVAWYLRSPIYLERAPIDVTPGQLPRIRIEEVEATEINLPKIEKQKTIIKDIDNKLRASVQVRSNVEEELDAITHMVPSILRQAFSGAL